MNVEDFEFPASEVEEEAEIPIEELNPQPQLSDHDEVPDLLQSLGYGQASAPAVAVQANEDDEESEIPEIDANQ